MIRLPPRSTQRRASAASDVYKRQLHLQSSRRIKNSADLTLQFSFQVIIWELYLTCHRRCQDFKIKFHVAKLINAYKKNPPDGWIIPEDHNHLIVKKPPYFIHIPETRPDYVYHAFYKNWPEFFFRCLCKKKNSGFYYFNKPKLSK